MSTALLVSHRSILLAGWFIGWLTLAGANAQDRNQPIPQNPAQQEQSWRDKQTWLRKTLTEAYDKVGRKDEKWDEHARHSLEVVAEMEIEARQVFQRQWDAVSYARQAIERGCDDPLILLTEATLSPEFNEPSAGEIVHRVARAAGPMEQSAYPTVRKLWSLAQAAAILATDEKATDAERQQAPRLIDEVLRLLPLSVAEEGANPLAGVLWKKALEKVLAARRGMTKDPEQSYQWVADHVPADPALKLAWLQARSESLIGYAWEARGNGMGFTVTWANARKMRERLTDARQTIQQAWDLQPNNALTATIAIRVVLGLDGDRDEMELWFNRAMQADGNNLKACKDKAYWLQPKWHGSPADQVAFGRLCGDTKNWRAKITLLEPELYLLAESRPGVPPQGGFWNAPEVWSRCQAVFDDFLAHNPDDRTQRTRYATIAYVTGHFAEADEQFTKIGDDIPVNDYTWMTKEWLKRIRDESAAKAKEPKPPG